jgi:hypothetical protein
MKKGPFSPMQQHHAQSVLERPVVWLNTLEELRPFLSPKSIFARIIDQRKAGKTIPLVFQKMPRVFIYTGGKNRMTPKLFIIASPSATPREIRGAIENYILQPHMQGNIPGLR